MPIHAESPERRERRLDREALHRRLAALQDELPDRVDEVSRLLAAAREATQRSIATRERIAARRAGETS